MLGVNERTGLKLFGREIIFEKFEPVIMIPKRHIQTEDGQTTYCRITVLCASISW